MADDQASHRRSRLTAPPTASSTSSTFRAQPGNSRFGFGSSTPRTPFGVSTTSTSRTTTLSTARTTTFSSPAFGRTTTKPTTTRPSSAETPASRLRQKPTTTTAAATSAPKTSAASDLFASLANDQPPRSSSGSSMPVVTSQPAQQLFSMDDSDVDDGWGVDSPSNILSPASALEKTAAPTTTSKQFEDDDELDLDLDWGDETPSAPVTTAAPPPATTPVPAVPAPSPAKEAVPSVVDMNVVTSTASGWGDDFEIDEATEASADTSAWNDDTWGTTTTSEVNGATAPVTSAPIPATTAIPAPPLSQASADLGAVLSPSGPAGDFWGDESDDVLFSDEEQPAAPLVEAPLPDVGALSLESKPVYEEMSLPTVDTLSLETETLRQEETQPIEVIPSQPGVETTTLSYQECETVDTATAAVPETDEWEEEEGDWGEQLRLSEVMDDVPIVTTAQAEYARESISEGAEPDASPDPDVATVPEAAEAFEAEHRDVFSTESTQSVVQSAVDTDASTQYSHVESEEHVQSSHVVSEAQDYSRVESDERVQFSHIESEVHTPYSHVESHVATEHSAGYYGYGESMERTYESQTENAEVKHEDVVHHEYEKIEHVEHHVGSNQETFGNESHHFDGTTETVNSEFGFSSVQLGNGVREEPSSETIQRQVSWEPQDKVAAPLEDFGPSPSPPTSVSASKGEVTFGTSSFAAAELTYGHYHHDHHRTPSEAEAGSVASFAEASSAGATFGGSDHVSDGTYSDGDYASETRSVFGSSSARSTAFLTEPPSSSDGQGSNEDNGTYDHRSDLSSTVGGGGGASEFDVSSTRSAVFENEVASTGFDHGDEAYEYGEHGHQHHFDGSYMNEYNHEAHEASAIFEEQSHSPFGHSDNSMFAGGVPPPQPSPSPLHSRSSTPATYGVSSSQDLPTASDLEFDHSDTENLFPSSPSMEDTTPFATNYQSETPPPPVDTTAMDTSTPFQSATTEEDDANPFASSGSSFPTVPATSFDYSPTEPQGFDAVKPNDEALPSADSLFGSSPAKGTPFGTSSSFAPPQHQAPAYDETPIADAGGLFADAPAAASFGGFEQPTSASASSFFGDSHATSNSYAYDSAPTDYGHDSSAYPSANEAFGGSNQSHGFESHAYVYDSSYHSANEAFGGQSGQSEANGFDGGYQYDSQPQQTAADAFGASAQNAFNSQGDYGNYGSSADNTVSAENFFGASSTSTSPDDMFGSNSTNQYHQQQQNAEYYEGEGYQHNDSWQTGSEYNAYSAQESVHPSGSDEASSSQDFGYPSQNYHANSTETKDTMVESTATSFEANDTSSDPSYAQDWSHGPPVSAEFETQVPPKVPTEDTNVPSVEESALSAFDHGHPGFGDSGFDDSGFGGSSFGDSSFGAGGDADSFSGQNSNLPPVDSHAPTAPFSDEAVVNAPPVSEPSAHATSAPPIKPSVGFENAPPEFEEKVLPNEPQPDFGETSQSFGYNDEQTSNYGFESGEQPDISGQFQEQSPQEGGEGLDFGGDATNGANPFNQSTDSSYQSDSAAFFGGQDASGAFGATTGNDTSGFFSNGPSHYHQSGGIYAQPPKESATPGYPEYDSTAYSQQHGAHHAYAQNQESHLAYAAHTNEFASSNDYSHNAHAETHGKHANLGSSTHQHVRSPTATQFAPAQSVSTFQHPAPTETAPHNDMHGGHHYPHQETPYHPAALHTSASPKTPMIDPSPQATQAPYNQYATPHHAPDYGTTYEMKATHANVARGAKVFTSNKHKDPNMVVPSCLSSFGFGGNVVTMFPKQKLRLNSASFATRSSPRTPQSMQYESVHQGELRKGPIGIYRMDQVHPRDNQFEELDKFPGPLNENVAEETILQYVEEKMNSTAGATHQEEDERLLFGVLRVLIKCNGRLRSDANANPSEPTSPEVQLVSLLKESDQRRRRNHPSHFPAPKPVQYPTHSDATHRNASRIRELLLLGDRKAAVDVAIHAQMWPEAMLIASFTDKDEYKRVLFAYFTSHYAPGDPCRALYLSFADQQERSVHEPQKLMQHGKNENHSAILSTWVVHVQMLLANRTADTNKILVELGDRLWKEANAVEAAHVCYLLAGNTVEAPSPNSKIALLGADHRSPEEARCYVSPSAVQRTEIYEWIQKKINPQATNMIPFQGYKLIYAMILADHGKLETAFKYVNSMLNVIRAITATMKPGTSMYLEGMQNQLIVLDDRLRQHLGQDRADSVAAAASAKQGKWGLGSALSIMGKIVNRVVEGSDAPQQAGPPRSANGSLFPGAPRSNNNMPTQPEYPSGAAIGYSSQMAPTMVPSAAPGSGRDGGIYAAQPSSYGSTSASQSIPPTPAVPAPPQAPVPTVPAAFNVPRQMSSGRISAPPHYPVSDFGAPTSGSGRHGFDAPPSGGNAYEAPSQPSSQPQSFPATSNSSAPPPVQAPLFQKPSLDLSGSAGNSGYGNEPPAPAAEAPKTKSPPRSPRARSGDAPGSDKGKASPKAKEAPKKGGRSKTPPPSRSSSGWLSGLTTFITAKMNPDAKVAKLGEHMDAYFDEEKKRWVFPGETQADEPPMPSAPPTGPMPGSTPGSSTGGPPGPPGTHSAPGSMAGGAASDDPLAALMAPPPARAHVSLMKKDPLAAMMAPPPARTMYGQRSNPGSRRPPPRPQFAVFKPAPGSTSSAPADLEPPSSSGDAPSQ